MSERPAFRRRLQKKIRRRVIPAVSRLEDRTHLSVSVFAGNLLVSTGLATDPAGNVFIGYQPNAFSTAVDEYSSTGTVLGRFVLDDAFPVSLAYDSAHSRLLALDNNGRFYVINPALGSGTVYSSMDISAFAMDT